MGLQTRCLSFGALLSEGLLRLCYPPACECCHCGVPDRLLCEVCRRELCLTANDSVCGRCGATGGLFAGTATGCDLCRKDRFAFERVLRLGRYEGLLAAACRKIKKPTAYRLGYHLADLFFEHQAAELAVSGVDWLVPVPLHWSRRLRRGYDQSANLADRLAQRMGKPVLRRALFRRRATTAQVSLAATKRRENVRNAFVAGRDRRLRGASVLLVDDILTTGATCHEASRALRGAGVSRIVVAVIARGDHVPWRSSPTSI